MTHRTPLGALACALLALGAPPAARADLPAVSSADLADLSLEDLMELEVTSVSRKTERLADSPAAVYVITAEDLRRSGATSIAEALRMVPGMQISQISSNRWAISARGFNEEFSNKLLVLIDGRSVYTPLFSGVFWDVQDVMLEDVDRIEVIRGPGATQWGANAVNGVVNVITRSAEDTHGGLVTSGAGSHERSFAGLRWGGAIGTDAHYRVYGKAFDRDSYEAPTGADARDAWDMQRGGFRVDWDAAENDHVGFQGDYYRGDVGERHRVVDSLLPPSQPTRDESVPLEGFNGLGRWTHRFEGGSEATLQSYFDRTEREIEFASEVRDSFDLDFQHRIAAGSRNDVIWGAGYRWTQDHTHGSPTVSFEPGERSDSLFSAFVQDEIAVLEDLLSITLGSKFEHNDYTGFEVQPSGRVLLRPHDQHTLWGSISRAVRTPSRADDDVFLRQDVSDPPGPLVSQIIQITGNEQSRAERLLAYEAGYRFHPGTRWSVDVAAFYNDYDDLRSIEPVSFDPVTLPGALFVTSSFGNNFQARAWGVEWASRFEPFSWWQLAASYAFLRVDLQSQNSLDPASEASTEGSTPTHTFHVRSFVDLPADFEFDTLLYYVENLSAHDVGSNLRLDVRLGWRPRDDLLLSVVAQNLQERRHAEYGDTTLWPASEIERSVYGKVEWRF